MSVSNLEAREFLENIMFIEMLCVCFSLKQLAKFKGNGNVKTVYEERK